MNNLCKTLAIISIATACTSQAKKQNQSEILTLGTPVADSIIEKDSRKEISVYYPKFDNPFLDSIIEKSNDEAIKYLNDIIAEIGDVAEEERLYKNELYVKYSHFTFKNFVSIVKYTNIYTGGAHGMLFQTTTVTDPWKKKIFSLNDFFSGDPFTAVQGKIKSKLAQDLGFTDFIDDGTKSIDDFRRFSIGNDSITFYFDPYQVAPFSSGAPQVSLSFKELPQFKLPE
jgi:hypothetical protein